MTAGIIRAGLRAPFTGRTARLLVFSLTGLVTGGCVVGGLFAVPLVVTGLARGGRPGLLVIALVAVALLAPRAARGLTASRRWLAVRLVGADLGAGEVPGWRALAYPLARLPVAVIDGYAVLCGVAGPLYLTYPFWWPMFRNHRPGVVLPVAAPPWIRRSSGSC